MHQLKEIVGGGDVINLILSTAAMDFKRIINLLWITEAINLWQLICAVIANSY